MSISTQATSKTLTPFQQIGVDFLIRRSCGGKRYLADDPGLGKTVQVCAAIDKLKAKRGIIICLDDPNVKEHWVNHLIEWAHIDQDDIFVVQNTTDVIPDDKNWIVCGWWFIFPAEIYDQLLERRNAVLVVDEAHKCKGLRTLRTERVCGNKGDNLTSRSVYTWYLSGSPIPNRPIEAYPVFTTAGVLGDYRDFIKFGRRYCSGYLDDSGRWDFRGASHIDELGEMLAESDFMLRREIGEVRKELPEVIETRFYFDIGDIGCDEHNTLMPTLRKNIGIAKVPHVLEYIRECLSGVKKLVVAAYHQEVIELLRDRLSQYNPVVINGEVSKRDKRLAFEYFLSHENCRVIILQFKSGGTSLDGLQFVCNNFYIVEPDWSDGDWNQLFGRLRRIGQRKPVNAIIALAENTLDESIMGSRNKKKIVVNRILTKTKEKSRMALSVEGLAEREVLALESIAESLKTIIGQAQGAPQQQTVVEDKKTKEKAEDKKAEDKKPKGGKKLDEATVRAAANDLIKKLIELKEMKQDEATKLVMNLVKKHGGQDSLAEVIKKSPDKLEAVHNAFVDELNALESGDSEDENPASMI